MEKPIGAVGNSYLVQPREVQFNYDESKQLAYDLRTAIDESFLFANYSETLATIAPLELYLPTERNETLDLLTQGITYDRANVQATINHTGNGSSLRSIDVRLFRSQWGNAAQCVLSARCGDDSILTEQDQQYIYTDNPLFHISAPINLMTLERERSPLNYLMYRDMLNHVVSLTNPVAAITIPDRNLSESAEALMAVSTETSLSRSTKYRFLRSEDETIEVAVYDRALVHAIGEPKHTYHEANIKRVRSFGRAGSLATLMSMRVTQSEIEATIAKEFTYEDDGADDIEYFMQELADEHGLVSFEQPKEFGHHILETIALLRTTGILSENITQLEV